jgi:hypothetical protein
MVSSSVAAVYDGRPEDLMQQEITSAGDLLDARGRLASSGWARQPLLRYDRGRVRASKLRIKEWDYYEIVNPAYGIVLLVYDIGYQGRAVVKWMNFRAGTFEEHGPTLWFTRGSMGLPSTSETGDVAFDRGGVHWECRRSADGLRTFSFAFPGFRGGTGLSGTMSLAQPPGQDTMVNAIPFRRATQFVYAQKINCMVPDGRVRIGSDEYRFSHDNGSHGCLDWSRAVFPYHVEWRWCTASGTVGGIPFGLNIDYGFGVESSKSMIFHDGAGHHLGDARCAFDRNGPMKDWVFTDDEGRLELSLKPVCLERGGTNFVLLRMSVLKAYGFFTGRVRLDDGRWIEARESDRLFGSTEAVVNYW